MSSVCLQNMRTQDNTYFSYKYNFGTIKNFGNADQTPVYFDMLRNYTVNLKGEKEVKVEKQYVTVILCGGHKLLRI